MTVKGGTDQEIIERVLVAAFVALWPAGGIALLTALLWGPLSYLFWMWWPLLTWQLLMNRCRECKFWVPNTSTRCGNCGQNPK